MDWGSPEFVIAIIALATAGGLFNTWIRAKHGYSLEDDNGGKSDPAPTMEAKRLSAENSALHDKLDAMQDRMIVLERIVTDKGYTVAEEIEALRDRPRSRSARADSGVPLDIKNKDRV